MRRVFIADAHLRNSSDENYRLLLRFLSTLKGNTKSLFILGDLFEFWVGFRETVFPQYRPMLELLMELRESGTEIIYFEGNHDFHLGRFFSTNLRAVIHPRPAVLNLDGRQVYICHGDQINTKDTGYLLLRFLLHNRLSKTLIPRLPPALVLRVAKQMSRNSKGKHADRNSKWDYRTLLCDFAESRFQQGCDAVISGHFHYPLIHTKIGRGENTLLSIGDWISQFSYGEMTGGRFYLRRYNESSR